MTIPSYGIHIYHSGQTMSATTLYGTISFTITDLSISGATQGVHCSCHQGVIILPITILYIITDVAFRWTIRNGATNNQVYNNTVYNNREFGISIGGNASNTIVKNNIVYGNGSAITNWGDPGAVISNNLTSDPMFVNASANDFRLQSTSPAIDAGVTLSAVPTDFNGIARPQGSRYDIGAYEYQVSIVLAPKDFKAISVEP